MLSRSHMNHYFVVCYYLGLCYNILTMISNLSDDVTPSTNDQGSSRETRSGRRVRVPVRYEPDPNVVLEDDYSDGDDDGYDSGSDVCSYVGEVMETEDDEFVSDIGESEGESESDDEEMSTSGDEQSDDESDDDEVLSDSDIDDVLDFDCLTDDATDGSLSSDDEE